MSIMTDEQLAPMEQAQMVTQEGVVVPMGIVRNDIPKEEDDDAEDMT